MSLAVLSCFNNFIAMIIVLLWANNINSMCEPVKRVLVLKFPVFCLKKERKTRDVFSCVKFMFITCDKKKLILLISLYMHYNCSTLFKRS